MHPINKIDFFIGVFMTTIVNSAEGQPVLFNTSADSKSLEFTINNNSGNYNAYIKYSTLLLKTGKSSSAMNKTKTSCKFIFSENEFQFLKNEFLGSSRHNFVSLIFTNKDLTESYIALLLYEDAMKCLEDKTEGGTRRITVNRFGTGPNFYCQGVNFKDYEHIKVPVDFTKYLGLGNHGPHKQLTLI